MVFVKRCYFAGAGLLSLNVDSLLPKKFLTALLIFPVNSFILLYLITSLPVTSETESDDVMSVGAVANALDDKTLCSATIQDDVCLSSGLMSGDQWRWIRCHAFHTFSMFFHVFSF